MLKCRVCEQPADRATYVYGNEYVVFNYYHGEKFCPPWRAWLVDAQKLIDEDKQDG